MTSAQKPGPNLSTRSHWWAWSRPGTPLPPGPVTLGRIAAAEHVVVSRRGRAGAVFDDALDEHGLARSVVAGVPTLTAAANIIITPQMTGLIIASYATQVAALHRDPALRGPRRAPGTTAVAGLAGPP